MWCVRLVPAITAFSSLTPIAYTATTSEGATFLHSHGFVHGEDIAQSYRRRKMQAGVLAFFSHTADPDFLVGVGLAAAQAILDTHEAAGKMFSWQISPEVQELIENLEELKRRLVKGG